jgi:8-oxo-dGTP pyrophosphatase MutT (NUDIX family)
MDRTLTFSSRDDEVSDNCASDAAGSVDAGAGALAYRRLENGELEILLVSKKRSKRWGISKGRVNAALSFGETAAKEAFEEAGVIGRVSPNSVGMFRANKTTPTPKIVEVWVYLLEDVR